MQVSRLTWTQHNKLPDSFSVLQCFLGDALGRPPIVSLRCGKLLLALFLSMIVILTCFACLFV
jgi:hypothetical protein